MSYASRGDRCREDSASNKKPYTRSGLHAARDARPNRNLDGQPGVLYDAIARVPGAIASLTGLDDEHDVSAPVNWDAVQLVARQLQLLEQHDKPVDAR
jgi:hypothetical protein